MPPGGIQPEKRVFDPVEKFQQGPEISIGSRRCSSPNHSRPGPMNNFVPVKACDQRVIPDGKNFIVDERIGDGLAVSEEAQHGQKKKNLEGSELFKRGPSHFNSSLKRLTRASSASNFLSMSARRTSEALL